MEEYPVYCQFKKKQKNKTLTMDANQQVSAPKGFIVYILVQELLFRVINKILLFIELLNENLFSIWTMKLFILFEVATIFTNHNFTNLINIEFSIVITILKQYFLTHVCIMFLEPGFIDNICGRRSPYLCIKDTWRLQLFLYAFSTLFIHWAFCKCLIYRFLFTWFGMCHCFYVNTFDVHL